MDPALNPTRTDRPWPDAATFASAVVPHLDCLHRAARRTLDCSDLAWDAVQEALLALWRAGQPASDPRAWLLRAVLHRSLHARRTLLRRRRREGEPPSARLGDGRPSALSDLESRERGRGLTSAVAALPREQRLVLLMRAVEELEYETIAGRLGLPVGTVRSRLHRARASVQACLTAPGNAARGTGTSVLPLSS